MLHTQIKKDFSTRFIFGDQVTIAIGIGYSGLPATQGTNGNAVGVENTSPTDVNVVVNGFQTTNNKGMVIEQFEPFARGFEDDALYRLVRATGREAGSHVASSDPNFRPAPDTSVGGTVAYYREYSYDKLGNYLP